MIERHLLTDTDQQALRAAYRAMLYGREVCCGGMRGNIFDNALIALERAMPDLSTTSLEGDLTCQKQPTLFEDVDLPAPSSTIRATG